MPLSTDFSIYIFIISQEIVFRAHIEHKVEDIPAGRESPVRNHLGKYPNGKHRWELGIRLNSQLEEEDKQV